MYVPSTRMCQCEWQRSRRNDAATQRHNDATQTKPQTAQQLVGVSCHQLLCFSLHLSYRLAFGNSRFECRLFTGATNKRTHIQTHVRRSTTQQLTDYRWYQCHVTLLTFITGNRTQTDLSVGEHDPFIQMCTLFGKQMRRTTN